MRSLLLPCSSQEEQQTFSLLFFSSLFFFSISILRRRGRPRQQDFMGRVLYFFSLAVLLLLQRGKKWSKTQDDTQLPFPSVRVILLFIPPPLSFSLTPPTSSSSRHPSSLLSYSFSPPPFRSSSPIHRPTDSFVHTLIQPPHPIPP